MGRAATVPTLTQLNFTNIVIETTRKGGQRYELQWMSVGTSRFITELDKDLPAREWAVQVLHHQLVAPQVSLDEVRALPDTLLRQLCRAWAKSKHGLNKALPPNEPVFDAFRRAASERIKEEVQQFQKSMQGLLGSVSLAPALKLPVFSLPQGVFSDIVSQVTEISRSQLGTLKGTLGAIQAAHASVMPSVLALEHLQSTLAGVTSDVAKAFLDAPLMREDAISALKLGTLWSDQATQAMQIIAEEVARHQDVFRDAGMLVRDTAALTQTFSTFYDEIVEAARLPNMSLLPYRDILAPPLTTALMLGSVRSTAFGFPREPEQKMPEGAVPDITNRVAGYLNRVHPRLADMWLGSWETLESTSRDHLRQAAHSARETVSQLLHELAPDNTFSPEERSRGKDGRPTRKMRIAYILRLETGSSRVEYIDKVAALGASLYDVLSAQAHDHTDEVMERQIRFYLMEVANLIVLLLGDE